MDASEAIILEQQRRERIRERIREDTIHFIVFDQKLTMLLNDFPTRDDNSVLATRAEMSFERSIAEVSRFVVQQRDRKNYGKGSKGTHVNAGCLVPLILGGLIDLPRKTWFNLGGTCYGPTSTR